MKLFHVKDYDRPMWVLAANWAEALVKWKQRIAQENDMKDEDPLGIDFVCDEDDLIA